MEAKIEKQEEFKLLSDKYIHEQESIVFERIDKYFQILLSVEWVFGIITALFISPRTWSGSLSQTHTHLWAAIFLGGVIVSFPIIVVFFQKGTKLSRYMMACSQMLFGALLIHLMGGRIEAHFHIFGSLAFLAAYRDWKVLIPATIIVIADHIIRGIYWPQSIYGVITASEWRWLEHAAWVIFEDLFLIITLKENRNDMISLAEKRAEIELHNLKIELLVKEKTEEVKREQAKLLHSSKMATLGEMAGGIAHEINNPLTIILGSMQMLMKAKSKGKLDERQVEETAEVIEKTVKRITKIISGLRNASRDSSELKKEEVCLRSIFDDVLGLCTEKFKGRGINLNLKTDDKKFDSIVYGDRVQLEQVFLNLLGNAFDAVESLPNPWIKVELYDEGDYQLIQIIDSGNGIPLEIQEKVFNPFYTTKEVGKGTGLGLSISKNIVENNGGTLIINNQKSNTCFEIRLRKVG